MRFVISAGASSSQMLLLLLPQPWWVAALGSCVEPRGGWAVPPAACHVPAAHVETQNSGSSSRGAAGAAVASVPYSNGCISVQTRLPIVMLINILASSSRRPRCAPRTLALPLALPLSPLPGPPPRRRTIARTHTSTHTHTRRRTQLFFLDCVVLFACHSDMVSACRDANRRVIQVAQEACAGKEWTKSGKGVCARGVVAARAPQKAVLVTIEDMHTNARYPQDTQRTQGAPRG